MNIDPLSSFLFLFETYVIAYTKKTEDNEWRGLLVRSALIVLAVNFIVVSVYAPELPAMSAEAKILPFLAPTPFKLFTGAFSFFSIVGLFLSEVVVRGFLMIVLLKGDAGDFTNSFIISLAKIVIVTMVGSFV